jgi:hypothetical protein
VTDEAKTEADLCDHCGAPKAAHKLADDCQLAGDPADQAGTNPHGLTRAQMRSFQPAHRELALIHGIQLMQMASLTHDCSLAFQHIGQVAHNLRHLRKPQEVLAKNFDYLMEQLCTLHNWTMEGNVIPLVKEMQRAAVATPALILPTKH